MPPLLASIITTLFVLILFYRDSKDQDELSKALWLPVFWMAITGTRFVSQWISMSAPASDDLSGLSSGSSVDAMYFGLLILLGILVLAKRHLEIVHLMQSNKWLAVFLIFGFVSIAWSDFPFISLKRYFKTLGHPVMALIILTDTNPERAFRVVMRRCAYLILPVSVLFIKYYPELGRGFDNWTGQGYNKGATTNKNELGYDCMVFGIFFIWNLMLAQRYRSALDRRSESVLCILFLCIIGWLLYMADSATSIATLLIGTITLVLLAFSNVRMHFFGYFFFILLIYFLVQLFVDPYVLAVEMLGREPTLTDRTELWSDVMELVSNPVIGEGFESFWLGDRLQILWSKWWWRPNQAHNGYIETYLNLGLLGLVFLIGMIVTAFRNAVSQLKEPENAFARIRLAYLSAIVFYNYTEATFKAVHLVWTIFMIVAFTQTMYGSYARRE